jgi:hypothetical protein
MEDFAKMLQGKKTYLVLGVSAIIWLLESIGILPVGSMNSMIEPLGIAGGATMVAKMNRGVSF